MTRNSTKIILVAILGLLILSFLGFLIGRNLPVKAPDTTTEQPETTVPLQQIVQPAYEELSAKIESSTDEITKLLDCKESGVCLQDEVNQPPHQWIRYAQFAKSRATDKNYDYSSILEDLNKYQPDAFTSRLYQYGDIILHDQQKYAGYKDKYLQIIDTMLSRFFTEIPATFTYYTNENPPQKDLLEGTALLGNATLQVTNMLTSTEAIESANAYLISNNPKYMNALNNNLNRAHGYTYYDMPVNSEVVDFKVSSCYPMLADVKAYATTKDQNYLGYVRGLLANEEFSRVFNGETENNKLFDSPMMILPCLDAMQQLMIQDSDYSDTYRNSYELIENYLIKKGFVITDNNSKDYGFMKTTDGIIDINSTAWLIKINSSKLYFESL